MVQCYFYSSIETPLPFSYTPTLTDTCVCVCDRYTGIATKINNNNNNINNLPGDSYTCIYLQHYTPLWPC